MRVSLEQVETTGQGRSLNRDIRKSAGSVRRGGGAAPVRTGGVVLEGVQRVEDRHLRGSAAGRSADGPGARRGVCRRFRFPGGHHGGAVGDQGAGEPRVRALVPRRGAAPRGPARRAVRHPAVPDPSARRDRHPRHRAPHRPAHRQRRRPRRLLRPQSPGAGSRGGLGPAGLPAHRRGDRQSASRAPHPLSRGQEGVPDDGGADRGGGRRKPGFPLPCRSRWSSTGAGC